MFPPIWQIRNSGEDIRFSVALRGGGSVNGTASPVEPLQDSWASQELHSLIHGAEYCLWTMYRGSASRNVPRRDTVLSLGYDSGENIITLKMELPNAPFDSCARGLNSAFVAGERARYDWLLQAPHLGPPNPTLTEFREGAVALLPIDLWLSYYSSPPQADYRPPIPSWPKLPTRERQASVLPNDRPRPVGYAAHPVAAVRLSTGGPDLFRMLPHIRARAMERRGDFDCGSVE